MNDTKLLPIRSLQGFDIREFHDVVLLSGAVPLDILEHNVNAWIATKKSPAAKS